MPSDHYVREKLDAAIYSLASSAAPLDVRLHNAFVGALVRLKPEDFADDKSRAAFPAIMDVARSRAAVADEGTIQATLTSMSDEQLEALATQIVELDGHYRYR